MKDSLLIVIAVIIAGAMISGAIIYDGKDELKGPETDLPSDTIKESPNIIDVSEDDDAIKGDPNAPVTMIEFSDFQCPYCAGFYRNTLPQIEEKYIAAGKVKLVYRDFPLGFHAKAQKAAEAAECADDQGKFWEMHDMIFENQGAIGVGDLKGYAENLGLDVDLFNGCLDSRKYEGEVKKDLADASKVGVTGTPTFFINGEMVVGAQPFVTFEEVIDRKLAELE